MNTIRFLFSDGTLASLSWPGVLTGLAIALMCAVLSPISVLKRMSFVGQGISHAGFGGVGVAAVLTALFAAPRRSFTGVGIIDPIAPWLGHPGVQFAIVLVFCLVAAVVIARLIERGKDDADTAIGIVLVASMTVGAVLLVWAYRIGLPQSRGWESLLFGDIFGVSWSDTAIAWAAALGVTGVLAWFRRPMMFWAFDEPAAPAFGVPPRAMKYLLVVLLAIAIVVAMKLAGVVLATAMLVLPGATALRLSDRWNPMMVRSGLIALLGVALGLVISFEANLPPGACMVGVLVLAYAVARVRGVRIGATRAAA